MSAPVGAVTGATDVTPRRRGSLVLADKVVEKIAAQAAREVAAVSGASGGFLGIGATPDPARNPYSDEAIEARYHTRVVALVAIERALATGGPPEELHWEARS